MRIIILAIALTVLAACEPNADTNNPAVATEEAIVERAAEAPAVGATSFTEDQARDQLSNAGYTDIGTLTLSDDGMWRGQAMLNNEMATVSVDYQGNIVTD